VIFFFLLTNSIRKTAMKRRSYYVYILANLARTLYTGVTNNLERRLAEHQQGENESFTARYGMKRLVYYEETNNVHTVLAREKQIKGWLRAKKVTLIESLNPEWKDLSQAWFDASE
jgi:putative endonuclease